MEKVFTKAEELADSLKEYINLRIASIKLTTAEKTSAVIANIIAGAVAALVLFFFVVFASVALAIGLGTWLGSMWAGFLIVAGLYLLLGMVVWAARGKLIRLPVMNAIIQQLFTHNDDDDETD
jgi:fatty acid desaturase